MKLQELKQIYLFKDLNDHELSLIKEIATEKNYIAGQEIFVTQQEAQSFFIVKMGAVKIFNNTDKGDKSNITTIGTGSHFGELPFLDGGKRSATAQSVESSDIVEINYDKFRSLLSKDNELAAKVYKSFAKFLTGRLRSTTEDLNHLKEISLKHF